MKSKAYLSGLLLLVITILTACTSGSALNNSVKKQIVEHIKTVEESEYDLIYFNKSYTQYHKAINEMVSEQYWASTGDDIVFGYDNETYTKDALTTMPQEEYDRHKERMLNVIRQMGMDKLDTTVRISEVYEGKESSQANVYTLEIKELKGEPFTAMTKKYALEKRSENWLITKVEQDKLSFGNDLTAEEVEKEIKNLDYQVHEGKAIDYPTVIVLSGVGK
ncbi:hypothetical protein A7K91_00250 [Paenibacillus oryzae]|uniref:SnoaL-like domain-containing protein n=1 Tax=Paenibacillus oryzae TaxID=1844972 RepID=A0A1A5YUG6_9BACL|nr:hypothetical protein [Paenibacillus oryzae]OBR69204.1 hypothetical protein A7K91_00250 [Paenibacillus oryzae]